MVTLIPIALEIHGCDLTNRVTISLTPVGNCPDSRRGTEPRAPLTRDTIPLL
jgi:hypothetical protein